MKLRRQASIAGRPPTLLAWSSNPAPLLVITALTHVGPVPPPPSRLTAVAIYQPTDQSSTPDDEPPLSLNGISKWVGVTVCSSFPGSTLVASCRSISADGRSARGLPTLPSGPAARDRSLRTHALAVGRTGSFSSAYTFIVRCLGEAPSPARLGKAGDKVGPQWTAKQRPLGRWKLTVLSHLERRFLLSSNIWLLQGRVAEIAWIGLQAHWLTRE